MEAKKGQIVQLWNGMTGEVLETFAAKAHILFTTGKRAWEPMSQIVQAADTFSEKDARFLSAKDRLTAFKAKKAATIALSDVTGTDLVQAMNDLYNEGITTPGDVEHFSKMGDEWIQKLKEALQSEDPASKLKEMKGQGPSLNPANYAGKKTRALMSILGISDAKNLTDLVEKLKGSLTKTAGHPNDFSTKYRIGDILVPEETKQCPELGYIHVLDVDTEKKVYVLEKRPVADLDLSKQEPEQVYGVRYEVPIKELDGDKKLVKYAAADPAAGCPADLVAVAKTEAGVKLAFDGFEASYAENGDFISTTASDTQFSPEFRAEFGAMVKNLGFERLSTAVAQKRLARKVEAMGRSTRPKYRVEVNQYQVFPMSVMTPAAWDVKYGGRPTPENVKKYVELYNASLEPDGANSHLGPQGAIYGAKVIDQDTGETVAEWKDEAIIQQYKSRPKFEVIESKTKEAATNSEVINMFLQDSFPKDKMPVWGTQNLKITKKPNGWALVNYATPILYRDANGKVAFNTQRYSATTSTIQNAIRAALQEAGISAEEMDEAGINAAIDTTTKTGAKEYVGVALKETSPGVYTPRKVEDRDLVMRIVNTINWGAGAIITDAPTKKGFSTNYDEFAQAASEAGYPTVEVEYKETASKTAASEDLNKAYEAAKAEIEPIKDFWMEKGEKAGRDDNWMQPTFSAIKEDGVTDIEQAAQMEQGEWEQTDHFNINYGDHMQGAIHDLCEKHGLMQGNVAAWDYGAYDLYCEVKDAFFEGWLNTSRFIQGAKDLLEEGGKNTAKGKKAAAERYKSDADIAAEFEGLKVTEFKITPRQGRPDMLDIGMELEFPQAGESVGGGREEEDNPSYVYEWVVAREENGEWSIMPGLHNWYPEPVYNRIISEIKSRFEKEMGKQLSVSASRKTATKIASLMKKADRLGNYEFDVHHDETWKLEAAEDGGEKRLVRVRR